MKHVIINAKINFCLLPAVYCLLFFTSCKDPDIGLIPDERIGTHFTDTFTIKSSIILLNKIKTSNTDYLLVGGYDDPKFGIVKAESYTQVQPAQFITEFGTNRVLDSIVLYLDTAYFYGDRNNVQTIEIYQLDNDIYSNCIDDTCYNFDKASYGTPLLGSKSFIPSTLDTNILNIKLDDQLGIKFLNLDSATLFTDTLFIDYFKGIAFVPRNTSAICGFTIKSGKTAMKLFYNDSLELKFPISTISSRFNHIESEKIGPLISFPHIHSTFPLDIHIHSQNVSIPIESLTNTNEISTDQTNEECYLQAGIGIRTKIEFPYLDIFKDSVGDVAINKAELVITPVSSSTDQYGPPSVLSLLTAESENIVLLDNNDPGVLYKDNLYVFTISKYIQSILYDSTLNKGLIIHPGLNNRTVNRLLFGSNKHPANPMKLKVYYTVIK